ILIIVFSRLLTSPLKQVVAAMRDIVHTGDLSRRVEIQYADEVGDLGNTFNSMTGALESAYSEIKNYALQAAISQKRESKIRNVFQKYVPNHVIEQFFVSPESMLVGQDRTLAVLFSDIRGFTTMSERMTSRDIVESLNQYFGRMVDAVMRNNGLVDKYIGDAIMAFFGAPADDAQSCLHSVLAALDMLEELNEFNRWQTEHGRAPIHIGIGINYGTVTIGNIGSQQKMDYTVVGDMVNVASRLEGLTRYYDESLLISESVHRRVGNQVPCRVIDRVQVKGRSRGFAIYSARRELAPEEEEAWKLHDRGIQYFYNRDFQEALGYFENVRRLLPNDPVAPIFIQRCRLYIENPPPDSWTGVVAYSEK
ncbi:adenylate/guanylate cyclase domain-containing protein, partial [Salinispira pacifica]